jgi:hypothetical protein
MAAVLRIFLFSCCLLQAAPTCAQYLIDSRASTLTVSGTSNLHAWSASAQAISGQMKAEATQAAVAKIDSAAITVYVYALKSGKAAMDKNMYKALHATSAPIISFRLKSCRVEGKELLLDGYLTIAGASKLIKAKSSYSLAGKDIKLSGTFDVNMADYKIAPPSFMGGAFRTGEVVTVSYLLIFIHKNGKA